MPENSSSRDLPRVLPSWLPLVLGYLQAVGPLSIDMYLPAFPAIERDFHQQTGAAQITLATWILGLSVGQLATGALADRLGRRLPLIGGTLIYTLASAGCAMAPSIAWLAAWRFLAALGASASMIVPRAVVRDVAEGHAAAHMLSRLTLILGAAPILAPSLGGFVLEFASWRGIFWIMAGYGALGLVLAARLLPDTLPHASRMRLDMAGMLHRYRLIVTERGFITHTLMLAFTAFALFAYLGSAPTVFIEHFHLAPRAFAVLFGIVAATYILCSQLNMRMIRWLGMDGVLHLASSLYLGLICVLLPVSLTGAGGPAGICLVLALAQGMTGFIQPTAMVGALKHHAGHAGNASAMLGTLLFLIGSSSGFLTTWLTNGTAVPMASLMLAGAFAAKAADLARPRAIRQGKIGGTASPQTPASN